MTARCGSCTRRSEHNQTHNHVGRTPAHRPGQLHHPHCPDAAQTHPRASKGQRRYQPPRPGREAAGQLAALGCWAARRPPQPGREEAWQLAALGCWAATTRPQISPAPPLFPAGRRPGLCPPPAGLWCFGACAPRGGGGARAPGCPVLRVPPPGARLSRRAHRHATARTTADRRTSARAHGSRCSPTRAESGLDLRSAPARPAAAARGSRPRRARSKQRRGAAARGDPPHGPQRHGWGPRPIRTMHVHGAPAPCTAVRAPAPRGLRAPGLRSPSLAAPRTPAPPESPTPGGGGRRRRGGPERPRPGPDPLPGPPRRPIAPRGIHGQAERHPRQDSAPSFRPLHRTDPPQGGKPSGSGWTRTLRLDSRTRPM